MRTKDPHHSQNTASESVIPVWQQRNICPWTLTSGAASFVHQRWNSKVGLIKAPSIINLSPFRRGSTWHRQIDYDTKLNGLPYGINTITRCCFSSWWHPFNQLNHTPLNVTLKEEQHIFRGTFFSRFDLPLYSHNKYYFVQKCKQKLSVLGLKLRFTNHADLKSVSLSLTWHNDRWSVLHIHEVYFISRRTLKGPMCNFYSDLLA